MAYATVDEMYEVLGNVNTDDADLLTFYLGAATKAIDRRTRRTFQASGDSTKYLDAIAPYVADRYLHLSEVGDICQITSITNGNGSTVSASAYVTEPRNVTAGEEPIRAVKLKENSAVLWTYSGTWESAITVVGRWAYSLTPPDDIVQACKRLTAYYYRQKDAGTFDVVAAPEMGTITVPQGFPRDVAEILRPYIRTLR